MLRKTLITLTALLLIIGIVGCSKVVDQTADDQNPEVPINALDGGFISGRLVDMNSVPISGGTITVVDVFNSSATVESSSAVSQGNGTFFVEGIPQGFYKLTATYGSAVGIRKPIEVIDEMTTYIGSVSLNVIAKLEGSVSIEGNPGDLLAMVVLLGTDHIAYTDKSGTYRMFNVPVGSYVAMATKFGYLPINEEVVVVNSDSTATVPPLYLAYDPDSGIGPTGNPGVDGQDGVGILWQGSFATTPPDPELNWAYYNTTNGISYIWDQVTWNILSVNGQDGADGTDGLDGQDGISIIWQGSLSSAPSNPELNWAYYNTSQGISYIYNGFFWSVLVADGADGINGVDGVNGTDGVSLVWQGELATAPADPQLNWAYHNITNGVTYIYDGSSWSVLVANGTDGVDGTNGADGQDGVSLIWQGELATAPANPQLNWAYHNTTDGVTYIYDGSSWSVLVANGTDGVDGTNGVDGINGTDGVSLVWQGELATAPADPQLNWAYHNTTDGVTYIYDGTSWSVLVANGTDGVDGTNGVDGTDGVSLVWQGELATAPADPQLNWAYHNTTDGVTYIYDGSSWSVLVANGTDGVDGVDGTDGVSIVWQGELASAPADPQLNWAYYNSTDGISYIWDGTAWNILAVNGSDGINGTDGANGVSITWQGTLASAPTDPQLNWAYYNSTDGISYIWDGSSWNILAVDGQ